MIYRGKDKKRVTRQCLLFSNHFKFVKSFKHFCMEIIFCLSYYFSDYMLNKIINRKDLGSSDALNATDQTRPDNILSSN